jgi:O-antigen/teichoic acid export membrane protein
VASSLAYGIVFIQNFSIAYFSSVNFFGEVSLLISLFSTLYIIFTCGLNAVVVRFFFDKKYNEDQKALISNITSLWLIFGVILMLFLLIAGYFTLVWRKILPLNYYSEFIPVVLGAFFYSSTEIFPSIFIAREKPQKYAILLILSRATIFLLLHATIFVVGESSTYVATSLLLSGLVMFAVIAFVVQAIPVFPVNKLYVKEIFAYAFPLMIYALGGIGYSHGYRIIISTWLSYQDLAIFTLASQISLVYYLTASSWLTGFSPKAYMALETHHGNPAAIRFYIKLLLAIGLGLGIVIIPVSYLFLTYFKDGAFYSSVSILPFLLLGQFFFLLYSYNYVLATFYKETKILTYSMFAGVIVSLFLAFFLVKQVNLWGAAVPIMCGLFVQFLVSLILVQRVIKARKKSET